MTHLPVHHFGSVLRAYSDVSAASKDNAVVTMLGHSYSFLGGSFFKVGVITQVNIPVARSERLVFLGYPSKGLPSEKVLFAPSIVKAFAKFCEGVI
jgi:hypothetical protein